MVKPGDASANLLFNRVENLRLFLYYLFFFTTVYSVGEFVCFQDPIAERTLQIVFTFFCNDEDHDEVPDNSGSDQRICKEDKALTTPHNHVPSIQNP